MQFLKNIFEQLNFVSQCRKYNIKMWQCPQFLFILMGIVIISSILATDFVARNFTEPEIVALIVLGLTIFLFIIGYIIIKSFERMANAARDKLEFIRIISHRFRSPLSAIKWQLDLLSNKNNLLGSDQSELVLWEIKKQNDKMIRIVNDLLELNFIEDNKLILNPTAFSLKDLTEEIIQSQRENADKQNIEMFISSPPSLQPVFADREKIKNVIFHLIDNAIRYNPNGGKVTVNLENIADSICLSVNDEGVGISKQESKKIFGKFFRSEGSLKYQTEGTGIGLFISKSIIENSGGKMGFRTIEGRGSTFWFTLPISR
ncbi:MAG: HAMP domain-containing sensor histidine kinase [Patescibacteria group bacterium]